MSQFLISYWWLIVIVGIIIAVIMRSLIKISITLVVLVAAFALFWNFLVSPGFAKPTKCFMDSANSSDAISKRAQNMQAGNERRLLICSEAEAEFRNLISCFKDSKQENRLSYAIYSNLPIFNETISEMIAKHNKVCPDIPINKPSF